MIKKGGLLDQNVVLFDTKTGPGPKSRNIEQTLAWPIQTKGSDPRKWYFFVQWGVKKATENEEGNKGGPGDEKDRKMVPKGEPKWSKRPSKRGPKTRSKKKMLPGRGGGLKTF